METKKGKYDTNPLDPDVERKAEDVWGDLGGVTQQVGGGATREVGNTANESPQPQHVDNARQNVYSEAPTRRYENSPLNAPYPSVFVPPTYAPPPAPYQSRQNIYQPPVGSPSSSRPVPGIGIPEKWATMLTYVPGYVGLIIGLIELFLVPRSEGRTRFHASQGVALHIAILVVQAFFWVIELVTGSTVGGSLFGLAAIIFLVISMIRVWKGEPHQIDPLSEPAQWFNQHIEPRNRG